MKKHRGLFLALGLAALMGLSAREARAENVTLVLSWTGHSLTIDQFSPFALAGSTADSLNVDTTSPTGLNNFLATHGSAFTFTSLSASSNNPGDPTGSVLRETGAAVLSQAGDTTIMVNSFQDGFTSPNGSGTLRSTSTANYTNVSPGTTTTQSSLDATLTPMAVYMSTGIVNNSHSNGLGDTAAATGSVAGYTLDNSATITLAGSIATTPTDQFAVAATFNTVPEPASLVMMLTGVPLPLVVVGLLRRRRAKA